MKKRKVDISRVIPKLARAAIQQANIRTEAYTHYIISHYRATGNLAPGCDAADLYAWLEQNMPEELTAKTRH